MIDLFLLPILILALSPEKRRIVMITWGYMVHHKRHIMKRLGDVIVHYIITNLL